MNSTSIQAVAEPKPHVDPNLWRDWSTASMLFHHAVGERLGLGPTDHKCLDLIARTPTDTPMTAGRLAELSGLTTGAITGVLDRLEEQRFVRREKDPRDRRHVIIRVLPQRYKELSAIFEPFSRKFIALCEDFTPDEMARFEEFVRRSKALLQSETARLRAEDARGTGGEVLSAHLGNVREGRLEFSRGASNLVLGACDGEELYRAQFEGAIPTVRASDGKVTVTYRASLADMLRLRRSTGRVDINRAVPWHVRLRGGAAALEADLRAIELVDFEIRGGASDVTLRLGGAHGLVPVRVRGGAENLGVIRPANVATRVTVKGGASGLTIDTMRLGTVGGVAEWRSPAYDHSDNRYDVEVLGGVRKLAIRSG
jgi:DNA-binding MarR family transcriptional regulator